MNERNRDDDREKKSPLNLDTSFISREGAKWKKNQGKALLFHKSHAIGFTLYKLLFFRDSRVAHLGG